VSGRAYHHGDLRAALVEAALAAVEARGADDVSLRAVARAVGVSPTAVYRHFPDKRALTAELARAGLDRLARAQRAASDAAGGGKAGFAATGVAYVRFALENPGLYRLIFAHPAAEGMADAHDDDAMAMLQANAAALAPPGVQPRIFALQAWALVHGLAMLLLDAQVTLDEAAIEGVVAGHLLAERGGAT
jgi:AcrR family transcriptional regulator